MEIRKETTNVMRYRSYLDRHQLAKLVSDKIAEVAGLDLRDPAVTFEVKIEEEKEGSPSYGVGYGARVLITVNREHSNGR